jgi:hypothetical protein
MVDFTQMLVRTAPNARAEFWSKADPASIESWNRTTQPYRRHLWEEVLGKLPPPSEPLSPQTRRIYDEPRFTGYEVYLPLWPDVFAYGVLLLPKDMKPGERRPVVVTQHGRAGRPQDLIKPSLPRTESVYKKFAAQLADRGFVVYAPQNPYIFEERYRYIQRKANPLKWSLFSFILAQHDRTLEWLSQLPFVDPKRIGFTVCLMAGRQLRGSRRYLIATLSRSAPGISTNTPAKWPEPIERTASCSPSSTRCMSSISAIPSTTARRPI